MEVSRRSECARQAATDRIPIAHRFSFSSIVTGDKAVTGDAFACNQPIAGSYSVNFLFSRAATDSEFVAPFTVRG